MNIIVTGGLGFIGSNLVDKLRADFNNVWVFDNLSSESAKVEYRRDDVEYILDDAANIQEWNHELPKYVDIIFHLAACSRIQPSFKNPLNTLRNNVVTTAAVCEFARHKEAKVVYAGSSSFYAGPMKNPYSFSKWQGEQVCEMYRNVFSLNTSIARFFNVYGPRQPIFGKYATVIGIFERQYKNFEKLTVVGTGEKRRDFTHVSDICDGLIAIGNHATNDTYNLGTGVNYSINEVADMFINLSAQDPKRRHLASLTKEYIADRPGEALETLADISKTTKELGWTPKQKLENYLRELYG